MKAGLHSILLQPLLTEKITAMRESNNTVGFLVHPDANRIQIKQAVESLLKVKVERVNVMNVPGKVKRLGRFSGKPRGTADAIETGCLLAQAGAIERMFETTESGAVCLLAGGAASRIARHLSIPVRVVDNLVLEGLVRIAEEARE